MRGLEMTTISSKGQVVIPADVREEMSLASGTKLMVVTDGHNILLKPVLSPKLEAFESLIQKSRHWAKQAGLRRSDIPKLIKKVRREGRS
jgi:AbrB family looped-hinge helix DNA binding protein